MCKLQHAVGYLVVGVFVLACDSDDPIFQDDYVWQAAIAGVDDWQEVSGTATVRWNDEAQQFTADADIENDEAGAIRPWHVHFNTCAQGGGIVGNANEYTPLEVGSDGTASSRATVIETLDTNANYHVNFHLSAEALETIIGCGDLVLQEE